MILALVLFRILILILRILLYFSLLGGFFNPRRLKPDRWVPDGDGWIGVLAIELGDVLDVSEGLEDRRLDLELVLSEGDGVLCGGLRDLDALDVKLKLSSFRTAMLFPLPPLIQHNSLLLPHLLYLLLVIPPPPIPSIPWIPWMMMLLNGSHPP